MNRRTARFYWYVRKDDLVSFTDGSRRTVYSAVKVRKGDPAPSENGFLSVRYRNEQAAGAEANKLNAVAGVLQE